MHTVTLLSIIGSNSIAVPLSSGFPPSELRYILDNSRALVLLSSIKFQDKAVEVVKEGLEYSPMLSIIKKKLEGNTSKEMVRLEGEAGRGGVMLYTSGTTSRPVSKLNHRTRSLLNKFLRKVSFSPNQS